jgi:hypothetical protein
MAAMAEPDDPLAVRAKLREAFGPDAMQVIARGEDPWGGVLAEVARARTTLWPPDSERADRGTRDPVRFTPGRPGHPPRLPASWQIFWCSYCGGSV